MLGTTISRNKVLCCETASYGAPHQILLHVECVTGMTQGSQLRCWISEHKILVRMNPKKRDRSMNEFSHC